MRMSRLVASVFVLFALTATAAAPGSSPAIGKRFAASGFPGSCAMSFDGEHVLSRYTSGYADVATQARYELDTIQPIASVSKTFIGLALAQLAVKDKLNLDAPIDEYLPWQVRNPRFPNTPITLRELATHTSSLIDTSVFLKGYEKGHEPSMSMRTFVRQYTDPRGKWFSPANFSDHKPGTHYQYSNFGADLAALVIEERTGEPFSRYVREHIFKPLGMHDTSYAYRASPMNATLYDGNGHALQPYTVVTYADGGIRTTCRDLTKYLQAVLRARAGQPSPLNAEAVAMALAPQFRPGHLPSGLDHPDQGLFWSYNAMMGIGHAGTDPGVASFAYIAPHANRGFVLLGNESTGDSPRLSTQIATIWKAWQPYK